ncbi:helix-turn-helix domain-containing protein [Comamonas sp. wu1-DMT]|uniref:helix-turn-helix domain-containing protein n=1 Tax=Comamonas sp. wu1-DMT TaxID=3126390 RepID=UPI0032E3A435
MSVKVMNAVFERYPNGGGEMLLALALADHASDDGTRVYPSIKALAEKTRQSERSVQYQLRRMQESGWLILVNAGNGGRSMHSEYRISLDWIKGAEIAPLEKGATDDANGANDSTKGRNPEQERVQPVAPANNRHRTINEPSGIVDAGAEKKPNGPCNRIARQLRAERNR